MTHALGKRVKIFCDNKSALDWTVHNSYRPTYSWIRADIKCAVRVTSGTVAVDFVPVPAHTGIEWNEVTNLMAKVSIRGTISPSMDISYPTNYGDECWLRPTPINPPLTPNRDIHLPPEEDMNRHAIRNAAFGLPVTLFSHWAIWDYDIVNTMEHQYLH
jgi:hypothetical protein